MSAVQREEPGYEDDFFAWTQHQAQLLRDRRYDRLDVEALAEEIESLGRRDRREVASRLELLVRHLLKWVAQPDHRSRSWKSTIREQRQQIDLVLKDSPSLRASLDETWAETWRSARQNASDETGLPLSAFPQVPCWAATTVLGRDFLPETFSPGEEG